jgi:hypothetical protein
LATNFVEGHTVLNQQGYSGIKETDVALKDKVLFGLGRNASLKIPQTLLGWKNVGPGGCGRGLGEYTPLANSSSTSASCSAAILNKAVTLYRFVFLFVRRRMLPGEVGSVNVDMAGAGRGECSKLAGDWYRSTMRDEAFCCLAKATEGGSGEYGTWRGRGLSEG